MKLSREQIVHTLKAAAEVETARLRDASGVARSNGKVYEAWQRREAAFKQAASILSHPDVVDCAEQVNEYGAVRPQGHDFVANDRRFDENGERAELPAVPSVRTSGRGRRTIKVSDLAPEDRPLLKNEAGPVREPITEADL